MASQIISYRDHTGSRADKFYKTTLFQGDHLMIGLNCLEPGQAQKVHDHGEQDKFYCVLEGEGEFTVGDEVQPAAAGSVIWAPAGLPHGVRNRSHGRLVLLMGMAPPPDQESH